MKILITGHRGHGKTSYAKVLLDHYPELTAVECPEFGPELLRRHEIVVGILSLQELREAINLDLFDIIYWVDASDRLDTCSLDYGWESIVTAIETFKARSVLIRIDNNGNSANEMNAEGLFHVHSNL